MTELKELKELNEFKVYGCLPKDCWSLIGDRCSLSLQFKIASTCTKLKTLYFRQYSLHMWLKIIVNEEWTTGLIKAAAKNRLDLIDYFTAKYLKDEAENGDDDHLSNSGLIHRCCLIGAIRGGHHELIQYFISTHISGWYWILQAAAQSNRPDLVDICIEKISHSMTDLNYGLSGAAKGGHRGLIDFFVSKCNEFGVNIDWTWGLLSAVKCTDDTVRRDLVDYFIENGANNWNTAFEYAARSGHLDLVDFFISKCSEEGLRVDWNAGLLQATKAANLDLVEFFISNGANNFNEALECAKQRLLRNDLITLLSKKQIMKAVFDFFIVSDHPGDWEFVLSYVKDGLYNDLVQYKQSQEKRQSFQKIF